MAAVMGGAVSRSDRLLDGGPEDRDVVVIDESLAGA